MLVTFTFADQKIGSYEMTVVPRANEFVKIPGEEGIRRVAVITHDIERDEIVAEVMLPI